MGKHGSSSSSSGSSSGSSSSDDEKYHISKHDKKERKKWKKQMKKGKIAPGTIPPWEQQGSHGHAPQGAPYGGGASAYGGAPVGGYGAPPGGDMYPAQPYPAGMPGQGPPPLQVAYPDLATYGGQGVPPQAPTGGFPAPGYGVGGFTQPTDAQQYGQSGGYPGQGPPPQGYPAPGYIDPAQALGYGAPGQAPGYGAPGQAPGYGAPGQAPGYGAPGQAPGYGAPGQAPGYGAPGQAPGYGAPGQAPGYGAPGQAPGCGVPGQAPSYGAQGVGAPGQGGPMPAAVLDPNMGTTSSNPGMVPPGQPPAAGGVQGIGQQLQQVQLDGCAELFRPTVRPAANFSAERDCEALRHAMKGAGTDERTIVGIIGQRSNQQRQDIAKFYKTMFGRDLIKDLESDLSGNFCETIMALFKPPAFYDAWTLHGAMEGAGTKEGRLIEILCTRTNQQIRDIVACYKQHFKRDLEKDITGDTSGHFKKLLVSCCQGNRNELTAQQLQQVRTQGPAAVVDMNLAREDAAKLQQAGVKRWGTDESTFITVLALRNMYQLQATFEEYQKLVGKDILSSIGSEMSGNFETGLRAVVRSAKNRPEYFADKLHDCIKGLGTNDSRLIRIIVSRSEIDLQDIKEVYLRKFKKTLESAVASDTSGDYKRLLLAIIGH